MKSRTSSAKKRIFPNIVTETRINFRPNFQQHHCLQVHSFRGITLKLNEVSMLQSKITDIFKNWLKITKDINNKKRKYQLHQKILMIANILACSFRALRPLAHQLSQMNIAFSELQFLEELIFHIHFRNSSIENYFILLVLEILKPSAFVTILEKSFLSFCE